MTGTAAAFGRDQAYRTAAAALRPVIGGAPLPLSDGIDWLLVVEAASHHLVTPALAWALAGEEDLPEELRDYLAATLSLNEDRNRRILESAEAVLTALNAAGIVPVAVKGAATLIEGLYPAPGIRILSDIDLLVAPDALMPAFAALDAAGFKPTKPLHSGRWFVERHHHLPMQIHPGHIAGVEVHRDLLPTRYRHILPAARVLARAEPRTFRGLSLRVPHPADRVAHNIAHSQLSDGGHGGVPSLRQLLDLTVLRSRLGPGHDWDEVDAAFRSARQAHVLRDTFGYAQLLLGQPSPFAVDEARLDASLSANLVNPERSRARGVRRLLGRYARRLATNPLAILNLLQPRTWKERREAWAASLRVRRW